MSISDGSSTGAGLAGAVGDPLIGGPALFDVRIDVSDHLSVASSHRPLVRGLEFVNRGWTPTSSEIVVSVHGELASGSSFLRPYVKAFPAPGVGDDISDGFTNLSLDLPTLVGLDEAEYGEIVVRISDEGSLLAEHRQRVDVLAYNQWFHSPRDFDSIAAFVFPNHPSIADIMSRVRDRLLQTTGSGDTDGYQRFTPDDEGFARVATRVNEVLGAIYHELQALNLEYSNPPASFEGYGQKVRTPDVILRERVATCLDSSVLAASCIAAAGLSPLIFLVEGHAFPGRGSRQRLRLVNTDHGGIHGDRRSLRTGTSGTCCQGSLLHLRAPAFAEASHARSAGPSTAIAISVLVEVSGTSLRPSLMWRGLRRAGFDACLAESDTQIPANSRSLLTEAKSSQLCRKHIILMTLPRKVQFESAFPMVTFLVVCVAGWTHC